MVRRTKEEALATRHRLLDAAEVLFQSRGVSQTTLQQIAQEAGFEEEHLHKIGMAVREAMVNAVVDGFRYNLRMRVHLKVSVRV